MRWSTGHPARGAGRPVRRGRTGRGGRARPHAAPGYALLWENSFSTGTPTLCRAREAQSRWKNSST
ncbi:hypothetical protein Srubr_44380 [Streptomyces rubradiris]|uniref:Uncharacterized protein n=1 Tax=Streptomyces rubradiris TaxID=285531 RepID=A0ABQ3RFF7_STRRR|nr:hypothetical protein GCM10018792_07900 [Streptomyces rubradiris]GHI54592.1 hypothetical protein Srubr_44380 [Streptomyces rubradiris]